MQKVPATGFGQTQALISMSGVRGSAWRRCLTTLGAGAFGLPNLHSSFAARRPI